ncbi:alkaline phosphatase family protein [Halostella sp. PRR32]|uniref:alkaline phosphatase family protein n=1 Tax=Halostella sp. PRR32 TaxID=3098147 RepID=UPI002B1E3AD2|nr:alkaline phosphatase family protein [Halostella sp. PRR32]
MIRESVERRLRDDHGDDGYVFPAYEDYCFANVPHTVTSLLGADTGRTLPDDVFEGVDTDGIDTVIVVLIDGFGLEQWKRDHGNHEFLSRVTEHGTVTPLTSIYPSETAAAITTFHTGVLPAQHGVIGWNVYEPTVDAEFEALPFRTKDGEAPAGLTREDVFDAEALYPALGERGVESHHVDPLDKAYAGTIPHTYEYGDAADTESTLRDAVDAAEPPSYVFAYFPHVDHASHGSGTESDEYQEALSAVDETVANALDGVDDAAAEDTLVVVTADHGHVDTDPERNVELSGVDGLTESLRQRADGTPIRFSGSPRNVHLQFRPDRVEPLRERLLDELDGRVFRREEVLDSDLFGDVDPSETFRRRLGDIVLTHRNLGTWFGDAEPEELDLVGMHGGLHPHEMLVPFAAARLSDVRE